MNNHIVAWWFIIGALDSKHFFCLRSHPQNCDENSVGGIQSKATAQAVGLKPLVRIPREGEVRESRRMRKTPRVIAGFEDGER